MDLDKYKEVWKNQPEENNQVSEVEIYKMTQSQSSSIVKWIFIIGILEFGFWIFINFCLSKTKYLEIYEKVNLTQIINIIYYFNFAIVFLFLYLFYKNYKSISTTDNTKTLMEKIIKTRKTVRFYMLYNILGAFLGILIMNIYLINSPEGVDIIIPNKDPNIDRSKLLAIYITVQVVVTAFMLLFLFGFYYLLYGILLKKLKRNYKDLAKLEGLN